MAKIMIVPTADYNILKKYLGAGVGLVLVSEESLRSLPSAAQSRCRELEKEDDVPYDFGGEPDVCIDFIHCTDSYAYGELLDESV